jgi:hypothetical protein
MLVRYREYNLERRYVGREIKRVPLSDTLCTTI